MSKASALPRLGAAALLAFSLSGMATMAQDADPAAKEKLVAAISKHGCKVTESNNEAILTDSGLEADVAKAVVLALIAADEAKPEGEDLVLQTEGCN